MSLNPIVHQTLSATAAQLHAGHISSRAVTQALLDRAAQVQPTLNCFVRIDAQAALAAADAADQKLATLRAAGSTIPPLLGVPLAHKDMFARTGRAASCGSKLAAQQVPDHTATVLQKLDLGGAHEFGVLNMAEFAYGNTGHNPHLGHCRNAWGPAYITGGSSSGSGSSVAARANFAALGSDTGGSIRHPASFCGTVGIKASFGAIDTYGAMPLADSLDTLGFLTRSVEDAALLFGIAQTATPSWTWSPRQDLRGVRVGVADNYGHGACDGEAARIMQNSLRALTQRGAALVPLKVPYSQEVFDLAMTLLQTEATALHKHWMDTQPGGYSPQVLKRLQAGLSVPAWAYVQAKQFQATALDAWQRDVFRHCDVLHAPVVVMPTPTLAETDASGSDAMLQSVAKMGRWTRPINYLGLPALSLPAGLWDGMPFGCQLIAPKRREALLFEVGSAYQAELGFVDWAPSAA